MPPQVAPINAPGAGKQARLAGQLKAAQGGLKDRATLNRPANLAPKVKPRTYPGAVSVQTDGGMSASPNTPAMQSATGGGLSSAEKPMPGRRPTPNGTNVVMGGASPASQPSAPLPAPPPEAKRYQGMDPAVAAQRYAQFRAGQLPGQQMDQQTIDPPQGMGYGAPQLSAPSQMEGAAMGGQGQLPPELMQRLQGNAQNARQMGYPGQMDYATGDARAKQMDIAGSQGGMQPQQMEMLLARMRQDPRMAQLFQQAPPNLGMYYGR